MTQIFGSKRFLSRKVFKESKNHLKLCFLLVSLVRKKENKERVINGLGERNEKGDQRGHFFDDVRYAIC